MATVVVAGVMAVAAIQDMARMMGAMAGMAVIRLV